MAKSATKIGNGHAPLPANLIPKLRIVERDVAELVPYAKNSRTHDDQQISIIMGSIKEFGFVEPILTDQDKGIIAGHGRLMAAQRLGMPEVPTIECSHLTETQKRALIISLNQIAMRAGWNDEILGLEVRDLFSDDFDMDILGFEPIDLEEMLGGVVDDEDDEPQSSESSGSLADRFGISPFSVLNAREGWWQDRKRSWLSLGIKSELGRGAPIGGAPMPMDRGGGANAAPGGSMMPAADYSKTKSRGDGRGRSIDRSAP